MLYTIKQITFLAILLSVSACSSQRAQETTPANEPAPPAAANAPAPSGNSGVKPLSASEVAQLQRAQELREEGLKFLYSKDPRVKNSKKAFDLLLESANLGDPLAMDSIGGFYAAGSAGTQRSCATAMQWFERSAAAGYGLAANNLAYLYVTCDDKKLRDPAKAETILKLMFSTNPSLLAVLDTFASLLAQQGNFKMASSAMETVIELQELIESNPERIDESKKALALFRKKKTLDASFDAKPELSDPN
jgi:TPR repeat protein